MEQSRRIAVAIDGPSGAGKSSIARAAARELGFVYVDTGAIYRTAACGMNRRGIAPEDAAAVEAALPETAVSIQYGADGLQRMYLNGEDVTDAIRLPEVSMLASRLSALPAVRAFLLDMQRDMAARHSVIMDGRDIGTVVLPGADVKIFLTASPEDRAMRRFRELEARGTPKDYGELLEEIRRRDDNDSRRAAAPLRPAADAVVLDTTGNTFEQSCRQILEIIRERIAL
ncbi:MAG: (d)CMP kinase [Oscillospiraceae bacterium]|jgi:cytidylate kinase|nr:(d)CMP kinase [Oscillospiraceae bacterium]